MKLEKSIVILKKESEAQAIDLVLLVKHPEGCDPVERLYAGVHDFLLSETGESTTMANQEFTWSELFQRMHGWD